MTNLKQSDIGKEFTCKIKGEPVKGRIQYQGTYYYLCQNVKVGTAPKDRLGFTFAWSVEQGTLYTFEKENIQVTELVILEQIMEIY